jgi:hypothetical protein
MKLLHKIKLLGQKNLNLKSAIVILFNIYYNNKMLIDTKYLQRATNCR